MTPEESTIIRDVFNRIRSAGPVPNDPQARAAISQEMIANPDAGIGLIQLIVGLEAQRVQLTAERDQLAAQLRNAGQPQQASGGLFTRATPAYAAPPPPPPQQSSSPWANQPPPAPSASPWAGQPQQSAPGGSFLRSALGSAAGVAGGLFAFDALSSMFSGHRGMTGGLFGGAPTEYINETTIINDGPGGGFDQSYDNNSGSFDTSSDDSSFFDNSSDDSSFG